MRHKLKLAGVLPAGKYAIIDPCYIIESEDYQRLLDETGFFGYEEPFENQIIFTDSRTKKQFAIIGTAWGDGMYHDKDGNDYPVVAGCIGCIPEVMFNHPDLWYKPKWITAGEEFQVGSDGGILTFGPVIIDTDPRDEYQEDE